MTIKPAKVDQPAFQLSYAALPSFSPQQKLSKLVIQFPPHCLNKFRYPPQSCWQGMNYIEVLQAVEVLLEQYSLQT